MKRDVKVEVVPITDLQPDPNNANTGTERGLMMLDDSLQALGAGRSVLADKRGVLMAGNKTHQRAVELGFQEAVIVHTDGRQLVVVQRDDLDLEADPRARRMAIVDNRVGEVDLQWSAEMLAAIAAEQPEAVAGLWTESEMEELLAAAGDVPGDPGPQLDKAAELQEQWQTARGQIWEIPSKSVSGRWHRLICGDSTSPGDVARLMGGEKADAVITDPPYNVGIQYGAGSSDSKTIEENESFIRLWFLALKGVSLKIITPGAGYYLGTLRSWLTLFPPTWMCIWLRRNAMSHSPLRGFQAWEPILLYKNELADMETEWGSVLVYGKVRKPVGQDIFDIPVRVQADVADDDGNKLHPTPKPTELFAVLMRKFTSTSQVVLDTFLGSGTTMVAAEQTGRICYGMEIEPKYTAVALQRMADMGLDPRLLES